VELLAEFFVSTAPAGDYSLADGFAIRRRRKAGTDGGPGRSSGRGNRRDGVHVLSFAEEKDGDRRRKFASAENNPEGEATRSKKKRPPTPEVGQALRAAYQRTIDEDIPAEMLDLLGKLG
jgi:hypothetical protein